jgi:formate/nitrite transporter FocA (FNT family)
MQRENVSGPEIDDVPPPVTELREREVREVEQRTAPRAPVVYEAIRREGEDELQRPVSALAFSGFAAGLSMGFSLIVQGLLRAHLPDTAWRPLVASFGYCTGFLIVILARQQLFTENTLTVILPLLARRRADTLLRVARLWVVVLTANMLGALVLAWAAGNTDAFRPDVRAAFAAIAHDAVGGSFATTLLRGIFAGWLIALMVWLLPAAEATRLHVIVIITYIVGLAGLSHIVAGTVEVLYLVTTGAASWGTFFGGFFVPTLLGNVIGGVALVAVLNHWQVVSGSGDDGAAQRV